MERDFQIEFFFVISLKCQCWHYWHQAVLILDDEKFPNKNLISNIPQGYQNVSRKEVNSIMTTFSQYIISAPFTGSIEG